MKQDFIAHLRQDDGTPQYLWDHLQEASVYSGRAAEKIGLGQVGEMLGWVHDLGKASQAFQNYIRSATGITDPDADGFVDVKELKGKIDHSTAGAQFLFNSLHGHGPERELAAEILSLCVASHHSGLIDAISPIGNPDLIERMNKLDEKTHLTEVLDNLSDDEKHSLEYLLESDQPFKQLTEKLKSMREDQDHHDTYLFKVGLLIRFLFSCLIDADRLSTALFENPFKARLINQGDYVDWGVLQNRLNIELARLNKLSTSTAVNQIRNQVSDDCFSASQKSPGIFVLTVPTGGGKTLASLRFAINHAKLNHLDHIYYVIPFTSIIDQNADRVRDILEDRDANGKYLDRVVLEHHSNLTPDEESYRHNLLAENWDAPVIFTTQVQFLETLFGPGTRSARRMHQLARSVLIYDEIQTLPIKCVHLFNLAIRFLVNNCGATVVLCTATQPLLDRVEPVQRSLQLRPDQHIIKNERELFSALKRVEIQDLRRSKGWTFDEVGILAQQQVEDKGNVLIIVNTKKSALRIYEELLSREMKSIYHLSTNMCPAHRMDILAEIREKLQAHEPVVCISTQLIEAGVDIDFRVVIRYMAGLDSMSQAAGRCNREGSPIKGSFYILNPSEENLKQLPDIRMGIEHSERILDEFKRDPKSFQMDQIGYRAIEDYYYYYFFQRKNEMCYPVVKESPVGRDDNLFNLLSTNSVSLSEFVNQNQAPPTIPFHQSFKTAGRSFNVIDSITQGVIVPYKEGAELILELTGAFDLRHKRKVLHKAQRYSVNLFNYQFHKLVEKSAIHEIQEGAGIYYLEKAYYNEHYGLNNGPVEDIDNLIY